MKYKDENACIKFATLQLMLPLTPTTQLTFHFCLMCGNILQGWQSE